MTMTQCESVLYCSTYLSESVCVSVRVPLFSLYTCLCACDACVRARVRAACVRLFPNQESDQEDQNVESALNLEDVRGVPQRSGLAREPISCRRQQGIPLEQLQPISNCLSFTYNFTC